MDAVSTGFCLEAKCGDRHVRHAVPARVFATVAEQLRWDALRAGLLGIEEWSKAEAYVAPGEVREPARQYQLAVTIVGGRRPIRRHYDPARLQGFSLFAQPKLHRALGQSPYSYELCWLGGTELEWGQPVPLAPLRPPMDQFPARWKPARDPRQPTLVVTQEAQAALVALSHQSLRLGVELGGALIGRMRDPDALCVEQLLRAPDSNASAGHFSFDPLFWVRLGTQLDGHQGRRVVGWAHTHLIDQGAPRTLSVRDLIVLHQHFRAPWLVAALVCASSERLDVLWFGWRDGGVAALDVNVEAV